LNLQLQSGFVDTILEANSESGQWTQLPTEHIKVLLDDSTTEVQKKTAYKMLEMFIRSQAKTNHKNTQTEKQSQTDE
jgi:hypothetical protein